MLFLCRPSALLLVTLLLLSFFLSAQPTMPSSPPLAPPVAAKKPYYDTIHNINQPDDYFWLRERENPEVIAYLEKENAYTEAITAHLKPLEETLYQEFLGRIKETDQAVPAKDGNFLYSSRTEAGKAYPIHIRTNLTTGKEETILDVNLLAEGQPYCGVDDLLWSPDHKLLAYAADFSGAEVYTLYIKDLATGQLLADTIPMMYGTAHWGNDNKTLFYITSDEAWRPYRLYRHVLGTPATADELLYEEKDEKFNLQLSKSLSGQYLLLVPASSTTTETYILNADQPQAPLIKAIPRETGVQQYLAHANGKFYLWSDRNAPNFALYESPEDIPFNWSPVRPYDKNVYIASLLCFQDYTAIIGRKGGYRFLEIINEKTGQSRIVNFKDEIFNYQLGANYEFDTQLLRLVYESPVTPRITYDYNMETGEFTALKQQEIPSGFRSADYVCLRTTAVSKDGTLIPVSIVKNANTPLDGTAPCLLYGYGSYGSSMDPNFSTSRLSLLDRGVVFALAHVRGGSEMGREWYENGKFLNKKNTFEDFVAAGRMLKEKGFAHPNKLAAMGGSAGGLLMGAAMNLAPDLFQVVVAQVPFVDVMNTMLDPSIPLTVPEYEEWGDPNQQVYYEYMKSYSPYDNLKPQAYPHLLVTAGLYDPRVQYWEPAKWTAKLRAMKTDKHDLCLKTNMEAGHGGASGRYQALRELAFAYAFILDHLR